MYTLDIAEIVLSRGTPDTTLRITLVVVLVTTFVDGLIVFIVTAVAVNRAKMATVNLGSNLVLYLQLMPMSTALQLFFSLF